MAEQAPAPATPTAGTAQPAPAQVAPGVEAAPNHAITAGELAEASAPASETDQGEADGQADAAPEGAPEEYGDFTFPEGIEPNKEVLEKALPMFKADNLTQARAQEYVGLVSDLIRSANERMLQESQAQADAWLAEIAKDPEVGGAKFGTVQKPGPSRLALTRFITTGAKDAKEAAEFREAMIQTGALARPVVFRFLSRLGQARAEPETLLQGSPHSPPAKKDAPGTVYPNMKRSRT